MYVEESQHVEVYFKGQETIIGVSLWTENRSRQLRVESYTHEKSRNENFY